MYALRPMRFLPLYLSSELSSSVVFSVLCIHMFTQSQWPLPLAAVCILIKRREHFNSCCDFADHHTTKLIWQHLEVPIFAGSWVDISGVISRVTIIITHIRGLITPLITTHEPPSIS